MKIVYIDKSDYDNNIKILNAIEIATNYSWVGHYGISTMLGYTPIYDEEGREVTCDPNFIDSNINICGKEYNITKHYWEVYIWKPGTDENYCKLMAYDRMKDKNNYEEFFFAVIDLTPDYVKEYWKKHEG